MTIIKLHNTATRRKEVFTPLDPKNVRMYVCGPTVYDRAHLGNARPVVVFDTLFRLLRHVYGAEHVTYVRNFTDVDDKINAEALRRQKSGAPGTLEDLIHQRTEETIAWYHDDMDALGALRPAIRGQQSERAEPRATAFIGQMIAMIETLIAPDETGVSHAYEREGHVLFRVRSYKDYGKLSGRSVDDMIAGARVEVAPFKEDPMDFVLWKPSSGEEPGWPSPWGRGRPGWHIECSAMAHALLGDTFDIHGGGLDLQFPHHENEIAQSCCALATQDDPLGETKFARYWMHNEMLLVDGKKMSKSLGNFFTVREVLDNGMDRWVVRAAFLLSSYREAMNFGVARRHEAVMVVNDLAQQLGGNGSEALTDLTPGTPLKEVVDALADDLDTVTALSLLRRKSLQQRYTIPERIDRLADIYASQLLLGLDLKATGMAKDAAASKDELRSVIENAINTVSELDRAERLIETARNNKDYARADALRAAVIEAGAQVQITGSKVKISRLPGFNPEKLKVLE